MTVNPEDLRIGMRNWTSGISIVSTRAGDKIHGMTVSSLLSVSLNPPVLLVSLRDSSRTNRLIKQSDVFGISLLSEDQQEISDRFSSIETESIDRFEGIGIYTLTTGAPLIEGSLVGFDCQVVKALEVESHTLFFGKVISIMGGVYKKPLVYFDQDYRKLDL